MARGTRARPASVLQVLERAVLAFPVSVDLWLHYTKLAGNSCEGSHEAMRRFVLVP